MVPFTNLLCKDVKFERSPLCQQAFEQVKKLLCALAVTGLQHYFQLYVDASYVGAGAVLMEMEDLGIGRPVAVFPYDFTLNFG